MITDWLMVIITFVYVVATLFICFFNGKSASTAKKQTEEMIKQYNSVNRPLVTVRFDIIRSGLLCFIIENEGPISAKDVRIKVNKEFIENISDVNDRDRLAELNECCFYLASKQKITILLGGTASFTNIAKEIAKFNITYNGFSEHTEIDLNQYRFLLVYQSSLEDISQHLKKMRENNSKFHKEILKTINKPPKIQNVIIHSETEDESNKFKLYKEICISPNSNVVELSNKIGLDKDYTLKLLEELNKVDRLIAYTFHEVTDDDDKALWYRR